MRRIALALLALLAATANLKSQSADTTLYVDDMHIAASDTNAGSAMAPLKTLEASVIKAISFKRAGLSTRVVVRPGIYRETIDLATYTNHPDNQPTNPHGIVYVSEVPGAAIVKGSDIWTGWVDRGDGCHTSPWPYDWGVSGAGASEIVLRREQVFVEGEPLLQVVDAVDLGTGSFHVDEATDEIIICPDPGVDMSTALVEVSTRERAVDIQHEHNVTLEGFHFEHAASAWPVANGGVTIGSANGLILKDLTITRMNSSGLYLGETSNATIENVVMNENGGNGWAIWRVYDFLFRNNVTSRNNVRGAMGDYLSETVGNKIVAAHRGTIENHIANDNLSRGLWLDYDNQDVTLIGATINNNLLDGLMLEANTGPLFLLQNEIRDNLRWGIVAANSQDVFATGNLICDNIGGGVDFTGVSAGREVTNHEPGAGGETVTVWNEDWTFTGNAIRSPDLTEFLLKTTLSAEAWDRFRNSLTISGNGYVTPETSGPFRIDQAVTMTFAEWQAYIGQENNSTFAATGPCEPPDVTLPIQLTSFSGHVAEDIGYLTWTTDSEENNSGFEIQRRTTSGFEPIGFVEGRGTTTQPSSYSFQTSGLEPGPNTFRLKSIDFDGTAAFSPVVEIMLEMQTAWILHGGANPTTSGSRLKLTLDRSQEVDVAIYNSFGQRVRTVHQGRIEANRPKSFTVYGEGLAVGTYLIHFRGSYFSATEKVTFIR